MESILILIEFVIKFIFSLGASLAITSFLYYLHMIVVSDRIGCVRTEKTYSKVVGPIIGLIILFLLVV